MCSVVSVTGRNSLRVEDMLCNCADSGITYAVKPTAPVAGVLSKASIVGDGTWKLADHSWPANSVLPCLPELKQ